MTCWRSRTVIGSMPANGSSSRMKRGDSVRARAISRRRRSPPESVSATECARCESLKRSRRPCGRLLALGAVAGKRLEDREEVLDGRHAAEDRRLLRQVAEAAARPPEHRERRDVLAVEQDRARVGRHEPDRHGERRRLSRAVRPEEADDLAALYADADVVHDRPAAVDLAQAPPLEERPCVAHDPSGRTTVSVGTLPPVSTSTCERPCRNVSAAPVGLVAAAVQGGRGRPLERHGLRHRVARSPSFPPRGGARPGPRRRRRPAPRRTRSRASRSGGCRSRRRSSSRART